VVVECFGAVHSPRALVSLQNDEEVPNELLAFSHEVFTVQVDPHIVLALDDLDRHDVSCLLLVYVLEENVGALSVRLTPLAGLCVVKLQAQDSLPELVHH